MKFHLCQRKAEMGHPQMVVILTKPDVVESHPSRRKARMGHPEATYSSQKQNGSLVGEPFQRVPAFE